MPVEDTIFKNGSTTYYWSSKFFPASVRADVFALYSFVRVADDYVDAVPPQSGKFAALKNQYHAAAADPSFDTSPIGGEPTDLRVVKNIIGLERRYDFDKSWVESFLASMQMDIDARHYAKMTDTLDYIYGSAEVIGLMMHKIMRLPAAAQPAALMQGRAMQYINFLRDINEDNHLRRLYFPASELSRYGLPDLSAQTARAHRQNFESFMRAQLELYDGWQTAAAAGYVYIPRRLRLPLITAAKMYDWTARQIAADPLAVYERTIKPAKSRVIWTFLKTLA